MEANKEQLITNIIANFDYMKQLLNENTLHAAPISTLIKIARLLEETINRLVEILSLGKLSKKKTTKHMEFSICWLTPPTYGKSSVIFVLSKNDF